MVQIDNNIVLIGGIFVLLILIVIYMRYFISSTIKEEISNFGKKLSKNLNKPEQELEDDSQNDSYIDPSN